MYEVFFSVVKICCCTLKLGTIHIMFELTAPPVIRSFAVLVKGLHLRKTPVVYS